MSTNLLRMGVLGWIAVALSGCAGGPETRSEPAPPSPPVETSTEPADVPADRVVSPVLPETAAPSPAEPESAPMPDRQPEADPVVEPFSEEGPVQPVAIDFNNTEIAEVIGLFAGLLHFDYVLEEGVAGTVTVKADVKVTSAELWDLFRSLLEINGLSIVRHGAVYVIGSTAAQSRRAALHDRDARRRIGAGEGAVVQVVPVKYLPAGEMAGLLKNFAAKTTEITVFERANFLILVDTPESAARLLKVKDSFDAPNLRGIESRLFPVREVEIEKLVEEIVPILENAGIGALEESPNGVNLLPVPRLRQLVAFSAEPRNFAILEYWIEKLDRLPTAEGQGTYLYRVRNGKAEDIAALLGQLFAPPDAKGEGGAKAEGEVIRAGGESAGGGASAASAGRSNPMATAGSSGQVGLQTTPRPLKDASPTGVSSTLSSPFRIINDTYSNTLIIQSTYQDYAAIKAMLDQIDVLPKQVMVEVIIADVTLTDSTNYGIAWALNRGMNATGATSGAGAFQDDTPTFQLSQSGDLTVGFVDTALDLTSLVSLAADRGDVRILSSPTLWATDNVSATINIGQQIPISTTTVQTDTNLTGTSTFNQSFQYQRVGLTLNITPRITDSGVITLDLVLTLSEAAPGASNTLPVIRDRSTSTTLWARDGQTLITGGLITDSETENRQGIPLLMDIPVLGYLFGGQNDNRTRTELLLLIRPHVVRDLDQADQLVRAFTERVQTLKTQLAKVPAVDPAPQPAPEPIP